MSKNQFINKSKQTKPKRQSRLTSLDKWTLSSIAMFGIFALWLGGIFDSTIAKEVRTSSVYAEAGTSVDVEQAKQLIGNRRLITVFLNGDIGDRGREICEDLTRAADGNLVVVLDGSLDTYGCAVVSDEEMPLGKRYVAETLVARGLDSLRERPTEAVKVMVAAYDTLVRVGIMPEQARVIQSPVARYVVAGIALTVVVAAAGALYFAGRRAAVRAQEAQASQRQARGLLSQRDAALAAAGSRLLSLDRRYSVVLKDGRPGAADTQFRADYEDVIKEYLEICADTDRSTTGGKDDKAVRRQSERIAALRKRLDELDQEPSAT